MAGSSSQAVVEFCGEEFGVPQPGVLTIGRDADLPIDDNPYLHRQLLKLEFRAGLLWLVNVGTTTTVTLSDADGLLHSWLSPGASIPIVFPRTVLRFTAGPTTYELEIVLDGAPFMRSEASGHHEVGETTIGRVTFTPDQRLLVLALAEPILRQGHRGTGSIPASITAAERLGWTTTKFNRKLDNVCEKLAKLGVHGLVRDGNRAASNRRARLVEYALAARLVTEDDLQWLDAVDAAPGEVVARVP